jgi:hypothetical protein
MSLYANGLRAQYHISGKTTFRILCAPAHKMRENRLSGSEGGATDVVPTPIYHPVPPGVRDGNFDTIG